MSIELEDLQISVVKELPLLIPGDDVQNEDVVSVASIEITSSVNKIIKQFDKGSFNKDKIEKNLNTIVKWSLLLNYIFDIECPTYSKIINSRDDWPKEIHHCGILSSFMLQGKVSELALDYFLSSGRGVNVTEAESNLYDIYSLVDLLAERAGTSFQTVLSN